MKWHREHLPEPLPAEPLELAANWLAEATRTKIQPNPDSMVLATVDTAGQPSARVVLCKEITPRPGYLTFYTNYLSRKGRNLHDNPRAALVLYWDALHRQVRVEGRIVRMSAADSDVYFATRNWQSRLGAWASQQSEPIGSRAELLGKVAKAALRLALPVPADEQQADPGLHIA
ncbi:MAG TPA: pyridoxal 5'-phosphate synthase, partial [Steroidobacteraceae bacterium]|nr:pyridoxal 5'-phosphate synthase [Steroidobacteraceae bacterium]